MGKESWLTIGSWYDPLNTIQARHGLVQIVPGAARPDAPEGWCVAGLQEEALLMEEAAYPVPTLPRGEAVMFSVGWMGDVLF